MVAVPPVRAPVGSAPGHDLHRLRTGPPPRLRRGRGRRHGAATASPSTSPPASSRPSWGPRAPASPRSCTCSPASTGRPPGRWCSTASSSTALNDDALTQLRRDRVGFVFQAFNLLPVLNAPGEHRAAADDRRARRPTTAWVDQLIDLVGLRDRLTHRPSELSGGQQQRVAVVRALASRPAVVFADEPTGNLDSHASTEILQLLRRSVDEFGQTIIMVTHDEEAAAYADRLLVLRDGQIVDDRRPDVRRRRAGPDGGRRHAQDRRPRAPGPQAAPRPDRLRGRARRRRSSPAPTSSPTRSPSRSTTSSRETNKGTDVALSPNNDLAVNMVSIMRSVRSLGRTHWRPGHARNPVRHPSGKSQSNARLPGQARRPRQSAGNRVQMRANPGEKASAPLFQLCDTVAT